MNLRDTIDWGIYLGTNKACIAVFDQNDVKVIKNNFGDEFTPCAVYEKQVNGRIVKMIGALARNKLIIDSAHVALEFRQKMGLKDWYFEFPPTGRKATAVELSAEVLGELIKSVKQRENEDLYAALITVPAAFYDPMVTDTKKAGEIAGLKYVDVLPEPIAAALAYGLRVDTTHKVVWLAYDLGGGTFDAALVKMEEGVFNVFDSAGLPYLGGKNLDAAIVDEYLTPLLPKQIREKVVPWKSSSWYMLKFEAETAKCQLSVPSRSEAPIECEIDGHAFVYTLTREELNKIEDKVFSPTIKTCRELLSENKFESKHIEKVILIGGPTLSPHLRKMIEEGLQIPIDFSVDPLTAVVRGAAIYARGRRIPNDVLNEIKIKLQGVTNIPSNVDLNYPLTTIEDDIVITGKLEARNKGINISPDWSIEIIRVDKDGNPLWSSGRISVSEHGSFAITVPLIDGENRFNFIVTDDSGKVVETVKHVIAITKLPIETGRALLPRGIGIATESGDVIWFFKKGEPLPAEKSLLYKTNKELKKEMKGELLNFPIVEGNENKAYLNRHIRTLKVEADRVPTDIPEGTCVEVTIKINESRLVEVGAYIEDYDVEVKATMMSDRTIDTEELKTEINEIKTTISKLRQIKDLKVKKIVEEVDRNRTVKEIETLCYQASKEKPEPTLKAQEKILELKKKMDPVIERGNEPLKFMACGERSDKNIDTREVRPIKPDMPHFVMPTQRPLEPSLLNKKGIDNTNGSIYGRDRVARLLYGWFSREEARHNGTLFYINEDEIEVEVSSVSRTSSEQPKFGDVKFVGMVQEGRFRAGNANPILDVPKAVTKFSGPIVTRFTDFKPILKLPETTFRTEYKSGKPESLYVDLTEFSGSIHPLSTDFKPVWEPTFLTMPKLSKLQSFYVDILTARKGGTAKVNDLLYKGSDVNVKDEAGLTALMLVAMDGHSDVVKALLDRGADVNCRDAQGVTALMYAILKSHAHVIRLLLDKGADVNAKRNNGRTPLMMAAEEGSTEIVKILLSKSADVNAKDDSGFTALIVAAWKGHAGIVKVLLDKGTDVNAKISNGFTALMFASGGGYGDVVKALLEKGAALNVQCNNGFTALTYAVAKGCTEIANLLKIEEFWFTACKTDTIESYKNFLKYLHATIDSAKDKDQHYDYFKKGKKRIDVLSWKRADTLGCVSSYLDYIDDNPAGDFVSEGCKKIEESLKDHDMPLMVFALQRWNIAEYAAEVLDKFGWQPQNERDRIHLLIAQRKAYDLREMWELSKSVLLAGVTSI